ncbi:unnamed protein product [Paramecium sonneborni]|uniref:Ubiquitin-like protease family profile domain-containing protein n=1 Tax=Paramecium sonneborni TaxID=65129 RepID=A0A8S1RDP7_9CILI|nr:unnamed protein product [Paramecium sonneborni]
MQQIQQQQNVKGSKIPFEYKKQKSLYEETSNNDSKYQDMDNNKQNQKLKEEIQDKSDQKRDQRKKQFIQLEDGLRKPKRNYDPQYSNKQQIINKLKEQKIFIHFFNLKKYDSVIELQNQLFYCNLSNMNLDSDFFEIEGKLFKTDYDKNYNPNFFTQEGSFIVSLLEKKIQLKVEVEQQLRISINRNTQQCIEKKKTKSEFRSQSLVISKIIIIEEGKIINDCITPKKKKQHQPTKLWCKYNQQINENDENILKNGKWLTSSIIDSFVSYLNIQSKIQSEKEYFEKNQNDKQQINRILFLPTSLTTNFGMSYDCKKAQKLFQEELQQFEEMNYELNIIYKRIGFPINKNNFHWQFLLFDFERNQVELFDSLSHNIDQNLIKTLAKLLNLESCEQIKNQFSGQQKNSYACGYYVCSFMQYCYNLQFKEDAKYNYNEQEIIETLLDVIKDEIKQ